MCPQNASAVTSTQSLAKVYIWKHNEMIRYGAGTGEMSGDEMLFSQLKVVQ